MLGHQGNANMKTTVIETLAAVPAEGLRADGLENFLVLCLDPATEVRQLMRRKVLARFMASSDTGPLATHLRARLASLVLQRIINGSGVEDRLVALDMVSSIGTGPPLLGDTLVTMLAGDCLDTRVRVLQSLAAISFTRADAVEATLRFLHVSVLRLRDAACVFAFGAFVASSMATTLGGAGPSATGTTVEAARSIVEAAMWALQNDERSDAEASTVRHAALGLLRTVAAAQIRLGQGATVKLDELDIKECVSTFLKGAVAKRETPDVQRLGWTLLTDFFSVDDADVVLLTDSFAASRNPNAARARDTYSRQLMADILPRVVVRSERDCSCLLEAMCTDRLLAQLFCEPVLRYAQIGRDRPSEWGRLHTVLRARMPLIASVLAAELAQPGGCTARPPPPELAPAPAAPTTVSGAASAVAGPSPAPAPAPAPSPAPAPASVPAASSVKSEAKDAGQGEAIKAAERRIAVLERTCREQATQLTELKEKLATAQKTSRDERRARLLVEERGRELAAKIKHMQVQARSALPHTCFYTLAHLHTFASVLVAAPVSESFISGAVEPRRGSGRYTHRHGAIARATRAARPT